LEVASSKKKLNRHCTHPYLLTQPPKSPEGEFLKTHYTHNTCSNLMSTVSFRAFSAFQKGKVFQQYCFDHGKIFGYEV
jgi:hypothetical protein